MHKLFFLCQLLLLFNISLASILENPTKEDLPTTNDVTPKDKYDRLIDLLQTAITEPEIPETTETQEERPSTNENQPCVQENKEDNEAYRKTLDKILSKIASAIEGQKTENCSQTKELPTMIPIFKPRPEFKNTVKDKITSKPKTVKAAETQSNFKLNTNPSKFIIPCQRASDILDMTAHKEVNKNNANPNLNSITTQAKSSLANKKPAVNCVESDETVAMLFKPKAISLIEVYGNILKKITITVLVPYHMSKVTGTGIS